MSDACNDFDLLQFSAYTTPYDEFDALLSDMPAIASAPTLDSLARLPQWVAWREVRKKLKNGEERISKVPFNPAAPGHGAKADDPSTWGTRAAAERAVTRMPADEMKRGVGIQLGAIAGNNTIRLGGIDLDSCLNATTGALEPWAAEVVDRFASYAEVSPSGEGIKVFFAYAVSDMGALEKAMQHPETGKSRHRTAWSRGTHCEIGLDVSGRYYAVTGETWADGPAGLRTVPMSDLSWLIETAGPAFLADVDGDDAKPKWDESGSGYGYRFLLDRASEGFDREAALAELAADDGIAGAWAARTDEAQLCKSWRSAKKSIDVKTEKALAELDDLDDLDDAAPPDDKSQTTAEIDPVTARLNKRHAFVMVGGRGLVTTQRKDGSIDFGQQRDLHAYYENQRIPAGKGKTEPASKRWMRAKGRLTYDGVTFAPGGAPPGTLNLWRGWAVEPDASASCELFLRHIREVVCGGNESHSAYTLGWLAHLVQRPDEKPGVGIVLKGQKGTGKDSVGDYIARMIGRRHAPTVAQAAHITGQFNARLENALMLHLQEGSWAGDHKAEQVLKYIVTSEWVEIEKKGIDSINVKSILRIFISANADWIVPASADERRWAVFEVSPVRRGDDAYFKALRAEMEGSGPAALLHYLQTYDLTGFNVRAAPETEGLRDQKIASLRNVEKWWFETLGRASLPRGFDDDGEWQTEWQTIGREALRGSYVEWMKGRKYDGEAIDERYFGRRLREMLPTLEDKRLWAKAGVPRGRQYVLPPLDICREAFDGWFGTPVDWDYSE